MGEREEEEEEEEEERKKEREIDVTVPDPSRDVSTHPQLKKVSPFPSRVERAEDACSKSSKTSLCGLVYMLQLFHINLACCNRGTNTSSGLGKLYPCVLMVCYVCVCVCHYYIAIKLIYYEFMNSNTGLNEISTVIYLPP